jgi:glutathione S-transferase
VAEGVYRRSTRGLSLDQVGFLHACHAHQIAATFERFYADAGPVRLLSLDPKRLAAAGLVVREEPAPDSGELFPHLYGGPLPCEAVVAAEPYRP